MWTRWKFGGHALLVYHSSQRHFYNLPRSFLWSSSPKSHTIHDNSGLLLFSWFRITFRCGSAIFCLSSHCPLMKALSFSTLGFSAFRILSRFSQFTKMCSAHNGDQVQWGRIRAERLEMFICFCGGTKRRVAVLHWWTYSSHCALTSPQWYP
jgi:hypothetical protein